MARKIIFHCNLERLWPYNAGGDLDLYALNYSISVDLNGDSSAPVEEITPWHCVDASMIAASADDPAKPVPVTPGYEPAVLILDDLKRDYEDRINAWGKENSEFYQWDWHSGSPDSGYAPDPTNPDKRRPRLVSLLGDLSTRQAPLSHGMKMAQFFTAPKSSAANLCAAPALVGAVYGLSGTLTPKTRVEPHLWEYKSGNVWIQWRVRPAPNPPVSGNDSPWIDNTYWLKANQDWDYQADPAHLGQARTEGQSNFDAASRLLAAANGVRDLARADFERVFFRALECQYSPKSPAEAAALDGAFQRALRREAKIAEPASLAGPLTRENLADLQRIAQVASDPESARKVVAAVISARNGTPPTIAVPADAFRAFWKRVGRQYNISTGLKRETALLEDEIFRSAAPAIAQLRPRMPVAKGRPHATGTMMGIVPPFRATHSAHPLAVPVSAPGKFDTNGYAQLISGYMMLVRVATVYGPNPNEDTEFTPWRCPSVARMSRQKAMNPALANAVVVAERASLAYGAQQQVLFYDGSNKAAVGPLSHLANLQPLPQVTEEDIQSLIHYCAVERDGSQNPLPEDWGLHSAALKFGRVVEGAIATIPNSGALPPELSTFSNGGSPGDLRKFDPALKIDPKAIYRELYLRRVPIGSPERAVGGTVRGTIVDSSGAALAKATVTLEDASSQYSQQTRTNPQGRFELDNVPFHTFRLTASAGGFQTVTQNVQVSSSLPVDVKIAMSAGRGVSAAAAPLLPGPTSRAASALNIAADFVAGEPFISPSAGIIPLDRELERDALYGPNAQNNYFAQEPGREDDANAAGPGTLNLDANGWTILIDGIDLNRSQGQPLRARIISTNQPPLEIEVTLASGKYKASVSQSQTVLGETDAVAGSYADVHLESRTDGNLWISVATRTDLLGASGSKAEKSCSAPSSLTIGNARLVLTANLSDPAVVSYRRPRTTMPDPSNSASPANLHHSTRAHVLLAQCRFTGPEYLIPTYQDLTLRRPVTDLITWDRSYEWRKNDTQEKANRSAAIANYFREGQRNSSVKQRFLDDPAVAHLYFEWFPIWRDPKDAPSTKAWMDLGNPNQFGRSDGQSVRVVVEGAAAIPGPAPSTVFTIKNGEIWELRAYSAVKRALFSASDKEGRIHPDMLSLAGVYSGPGAAMEVGRRTITYNGTEYVLFGPTSFRFEAAAPPDTTIAPANQLAQATQPGFSELPDTVYADFDRPTAAAGAMSFARDSFAAAFSQATLSIQEWRWMGRPFSKPFPFDQLNAARLSDWEQSGGYNGRPDRDAREVNIAIPLYTPRPRLWTEDVSNDLGALYYRLHVTLRPRFAVLGGAYAAEITSAAAGGDWSRQFVPCRQTKSIPKPLIRLVVPLTQAAEWDVSASGAPLPADQNGSPGLLVLAAERWYGFGGLNESLLARVVNTKEEQLRVPDPKVGFLQEIGYDPILTPKAVRSTTIDFSPDSVIGPIGHTLDVGLPAPIFRACSFILKIPAGLKAKYWPMAIVRFRRHLEKEGIAKRVASLPDTVFDSEETPLHHVQFLPDPKRFFGTSDPTQLSISLEAGNLSFKKGGSTIKFNPPPQGGLWAVVTQSIYDAFGIPQEKFVDLYALKADQQTFEPFKLTNGAPSGALTARLIEVQWPKAVSPSSDVSYIDLLFPPSGIDDAQVRIVAVSGPVGQIDASEDHSHE